MNRLVITRIEQNKKEFLAYILLDEKRRFLDLQVFEPREKMLLDNIYVGYVEKLVSNIHAAFVRIADGQKCYLPLEEVKSPVFSKKLSKTKPLCEGDELLVQVTRDAVKTKDPVVSTKLTLHGHYCFLTTENTRIGVSKKLPDERAKELLACAREICTGHEESGYGLVIRTNAADVGNAELTEDIRTVQEELERIRTTAIHACHGTLVYRNLPGYLARLKGQNFDRIDGVWTDRQDIFDEIAAYLPKLQTCGLLHFYRDDAVSLATLYHLRGNLDQLLSSKVWLDSGANIIIESLETLTVIDVNSGRNQSRSPEALFAINLEAAKEIARQLRLRNISGMIIIDFINLKSGEQQEMLVRCVKEELKKDPVPAKFIDITKLGLVELTRKKGYKSLREILAKTLDE